MSVGRVFTPYPKGTPMGLYMSKNYSVPRELLWSIFFATPERVKYSFHSGGTRLNELNHSFDSGGTNVVWCQELKKPDSATAF